MYDVYEEVFALAGSWRRLARSLRLPPPLVPLIAEKNQGDPEDCLFAVLQKWLKRIHDVKRHGYPSWHSLVKAVAHPAGGANPALAESIAEKYPGKASIM